jgi:hypothetical protein
VTRAQRPIFTLQVRAKPGADPVQALRKWLKRGLRGLWFAMRRTSTRESEGDDDACQKVRFDALRTG